MTAVMERTFGIEMEYGYPYRVNDSQLYSAIHSALRSVPGCQSRQYDWAISEDGGGYEVRTPVLTWDRWDEVRAVTAALRGVGGRYLQSAGMHVHLGLGDMDNDDRVILRWFVLWAALEAGIFKLVHRHRQGNQWCASVLGNHPWNELRRALLSNTQQDARFVRETYRRALHPVSRHGTSECRLHQASLDPVKQRNWLLMLQALMYHAEVETDALRIVPLYNLTVEDKIRTVQTIVQEHLPSKLGAWVAKKVAERAQRYSGVQV